MTEREVVAGCSDLLSRLASAVEADLDQTRRGDIWSRARGELLDVLDEARRVLRTPPVATQTADPLSVELEAAIGALVSAWRRMPARSALELVAMGLEFLWHSHDNDVDTTAARIRARKALRGDDP